MIKFLQKKIPGGKLIQVKIDSDEIINQVDITGDFFLHPENLLEHIENIFVGAHIPINKEILMEKITHTLKENEASFIGASPEDLVNLVEECIQNGKIQTD